MGHYASEIDPDWGKPRTMPSEVYGTGDEAVDALMDNLHDVFEFKARAASAAKAIAAFIDARLARQR